MFLIFPQGWYWIQISIYIFSVLGYMILDYRIIIKVIIGNDLYYCLFKPCSSSNMNAGWGQAKLPALYWLLLTPWFQYHWELRLIAFQLYQAGNFTFLKCSCHGNSRVLGFLFSEGIERLNANIRTHINMWNSVLFLNWRGEEIKMAPEYFH